MADSTEVANIDDAVGPYIDELMTIADELVTTSMGGFFPSSINWEATTSTPITVTNASPNTTAFDADVEARVDSFKTDIDTVFTVADALEFASVSEPDTSGAPEKFTDVAPSFNDIEINDFDKTPPEELYPDIPEAFATEAPEIALISPNLFDKSYEPIDYPNAVPTLEATAPIEPAVDFSLDAPEEPNVDDILAKELDMTFEVVYPDLPDLSNRPSLDTPFPDAFVPSNPVDVNNNPVTALDLSRWTSIVEGDTTLNSILTLIQDALTQEKTLDDVLADFSYLWAETAERVGSDWLLSEPDLPTEPDTGSFEASWKSFEFTLPEEDAGWENYDFDTAALIFPEEALVWQGEQLGWSSADLTEPNDDLVAMNETLIWQRQLERNQMTFDTSIQRVNEEFSLSGFALPPGKRDAAIRELALANAYQRTESSREVALKQVDVAVRMVELKQALQQFVIDKQQVWQQFVIEKEQQWQEFVLGLRVDLQKFSKDQEKTWTTFSMDKSLSWQQFLIDKRLTLKQFSAEKDLLWQQFVAEKKYAWEQFVREKKQQWAEFSSAKQLEADSLNVVQENEFKKTKETSTLDWEKHFSSISADFEKAGKEIANNFQIAAMNAGVSVYNAKVGYATQMGRVAYEIAKAQLDAQLAVYNQEVDIWKQGIVLYQADAEAYATEMRGFLADVEVYKGQLEAVRAKVDVRQADIEAYKAVLSTANIRAEIYNTLMNGYNSRLTAERTKIEMYGKQIDAYQGLINAYVAQWNGYTAQIQGEKTKVDIFNSEIAAYKAQIDGEIARNTAEIQKIQAYTAQIEGYKANVESYKAQVDVEVNKQQVFKSQVDAYNAYISSRKSKIDVEIAKQESFKSAVSAYQALVGSYEAKLKAENMKISAEATSIQVNITKYNALMDKVKALSAVFGGEMNAYQTGAAKASDLARIENEKEKTLAELEIKSAELSLRERELAKNLAVNQTQTYANAMAANKEATVSALTAAGQIYQGVLSPYFRGALSLAEESTEA